MNAPARIPWATLTVFALMEVFVFLQVLYPAIIPVLMRAPAMIDNGEYWRFVTAWLVQVDGLVQIGVNTLALIMVGSFAERFWPRWVWVLAYVAAGLAGEVAGYFWQPVGGGNSVAIAGLAGIALVQLLDAERLPPPIRFLWPAAGLVFALYLTAIHDIHGPPLLAGGAIGLAGRRLGLDFREAE